MSQKSQLIDRLGAVVFGQANPRGLAGFAEALVAALPLLAVGLALGAFLTLALLRRRGVYVLLFIVVRRGGPVRGNPDLRTYSYHGMIYLGYVFATEREPWSPEDPYLAGAPLTYPWGYFALVGRLSALSSWAPSGIFTALNLAALGATVILVARITRLLGGGVADGNCAVVVGILAPTALGSGIALVFEPLRPLAIDPAVVDVFWFPFGLPPP